MIKIMLVAERNAEQPDDAVNVDFTVVDQGSQRLFADAGFNQTFR